MPIYEYKCHKCGYEFEHLAKKFSEKPPACPKCHSHQCSRLLSTFNTPTSVNRKSPCADGVCPVSDTCPSGQCCPNLCASD